MCACSERFRSPHASRGKPVLRCSSASTGPTCWTWITCMASQISPARCRRSLATTFRALATPLSARRNSPLKHASCSFRSGSRSSTQSEGTRSPTPRLCAGQLFVVLARSSEEEKVKPYTTVGLIPSVRGIRRRKDIKINLEHLQHLVKAASWLSALDIPVRLIAFPEGALQAFNDEVLDLDHVQFARECAIDIPGEETEELGKIAKQYNVFIIAQAKAKHPEIKDRFFNVGFILNPEGEVILRHYKVSPLFPRSEEHTSELQSLTNLVCRLLLEKKKKKK